MRRSTEQDRSAADEWDRIAAGVRAFLRDGADVRAVDEHAAASRDEPRWKLNSTDLLLACLIVVVAFAMILLPFPERACISPKA